MPEPVGLAEAGGRTSDEVDVAAARPLRGKDPLLDLIRVSAIGRVVLWHTWSWPWLTWVPAMPAMFFVTGALLDGSLERRGWWTTLQSRLRRLLIPYWVYAAACWVVMLADGWRPTVGDAARWAVPLMDPVGSEQLPGLWIPLWYLRAYLWFLLGSGLIRGLQRRLGDAAVPLAAAAAVSLWLLSRRGVEVPLAVGDAVTYLPFVMAGLGYGASRRVPSKAVLLVVGVTAAVAAVVTWQRYGPADGVVNRSYLLTMLVGLAGVALVFAFRTQILRATAPGEAVISRVNSRALTIYLWQGFGLITAQRLVDQRLDPGPLRAVLSLAVVAVVIAGAVALFGVVEDRAAGRGRSSERRAVRVVGVPAPFVAVLPAIALVAAALIVPVPADARIDAPLSGQAVVARGGMIEAELDQRLPRADVTGLSPQEVLDEWVAEHREMLRDIGTDWIDGAVAAPDGTVTELSWNEYGAELTETISWWSMTKAMTSAWFVSLVDQGVVELDDRLGEYVPESPRADEMTLEQLARHISGVPPDLDGDLFDANPARELDAFFERGDLAFEPGEGYGYSRVGYYLLALALERASGVTWEDAMRSMADQAGAIVGIDDDWHQDDPVSDPDGHGYHGGLWSAGGLISSVPDGVTLLHWVFGEGLSDAAIDAMTRFPASEDRHYYGLGLVPMCPCETVGDTIRSDRFGLDTATGTFAVDRRSGAAVMVRPENWWGDDGPQLEFYDLQQRLLDAVS